MWEGEKIEQINGCTFGLMISNSEFEMKNKIAANKIFNWLQVYA